MRSIIDRVDALEDAIGNADMTARMAAMERRIMALEDIVENKLGIYIPKPLRK